MTRLRAVFQLATMTAVALVAAGSVAAADVCPSKVIKIVVANPPGGIGDLVARTLGDRVSAEIGQPVVIENRAGASTVIGTDAVAKAKPDGCTILSLTASGVVISVLQDKLPYDLHRDFLPIISVGSFPMVLAVPVASGITSMDQLAAVAKSKDGVTYGSGGSGTLAHLSAARLINEMKGSGNHIPYRGNPDATQALLGNQIQLFFPGSAEALHLESSGKVKILAVTSDKRLTALPNVPTMKELGYADFTPRLWYAFLAPAGTPREAINALNAAFVKAVTYPPVQEKLTALGFAMDIKQPAEVSALMRSEGERWAKVIKDNGVKAGN